MIAVCSNRPRPMVQSSRSYMLKTGASAWGRDVWHVLAGDDDSTPLYRQQNARTLCGVACPDWIIIGKMDGPDRHICNRCEHKLETAA